MTAFAAVYNMATGCWNFICHYIFKLKPIVVYGY